MFRRLHFLLPNAKLAQNVVNELLGLGVQEKHIHTFAEHKQPINSLRPATPRQKQDRAQHLENFFWNANLVIFAIFLILFLLTLMSGQYQYSLLCLGIMLLSFTLGNFFIQHIPHIHLNNFKDALSHNELLMMVDVPDEKAAEIENNIHRHHPAAIEGGSSWTVKGVDI